MIRKTLSLLAISMLSLLYANAQTGDYGAQWKKIAGLEKKGLTKDALKEVTAIFTDAVAKGNDQQQIKAAMYQMAYRNMTEEDDDQKNLFFIDTLIAKAKAPAKNILLSIQAQLFQSYKENYRYQLYNRTALVEEKGNDVTTWSITKLNDKISGLYKSSLKNEALLKATPIKAFAAVIDPGKNTAALRPTLYDLLAHRALEYFTNTENDVTDASYKFIINDESAFAPLTDFTRHHFITKDTSSLYYNGLLLMQNILRFHANDIQPDALLDANLDRLAFVHEHGVFPDKEKLYERSLQNIETNYSSNPSSAMALYLRAQLYKEHGDKYAPLTAKENQFELVKALQTAQLAYSRFPKSEGGINAYNLINEIKKPSLSFQVESVNIPGQPFRSLIKYTNTDKVYFRLVKVTRDQLKKWNEDNEDNKKLKAILALKPERSWNNELPDQKDYQQHSAETKIDALSAGTYYLLAGRNENFTLANNIISSQVIYVSNLSYIINSNRELYALNRDNGMPLKGAEVQLWSNTYDYNLRKYQEVRNGSYTTNENGFAKLIRTVQNSSVIQLKYKGEELFTNDQYNSYSYDDYRQAKTSTRQTFLFTDRAIYRPGQTVFFKGIMTITDTSRRHSQILPGIKTTVLLFDANDQQVDSMTVYSNDYGSFNGSFKIPEGKLNGNFSIKESLSESTTGFSVEEYKRPTFSADIKIPDGTYRVNDSISITGTAKAFAGNNIDGAKVTYRVVRNVNYPIWFEYYRGFYPENTEEMEITNGETNTDAAGQFTIVFKAIPDETVDKKDQPTFSYSITADVTDITGETRSADQSVSVAYQALQLNITGDAVLPTDSVKNIGVSSTNINGLFEKATVHFTMYKLQEPVKILRSRYWSAPDVFIISKEEYNLAFPYDIYGYEDQVSQWPLGEKLIDKTGTTSANSSFNIRNSNFIPGWYKIVVTSKDKFGEDEKAEKFIQLTGKQATHEPITLVPDKIQAEPGQQIIYHISTGFDKIFLIQNKMRSEDPYTTTYPVIGVDKPEENTIMPDESDRGGIVVNYIFIKHNRVYKDGQDFDIPWNNKELKISYETFRDKTLPGSEEKWKVKITGDKAEKVASETLISMYDASLDEFKPHEWNSLSSLWPGLNSNLNWEAGSFDAVSSEENDEIKEKDMDVPEKNYPSLMDYGYNDFSGSYRRGYDRKGVTYLFSANAATGAAKDEDMERAPAPPVGNTKITNQSTIVQTQFAVPLLKITADSVGNEIGTLSYTPTPPKVNSAQNTTIRKNFNETAFFFPDMHTDADGNVEFSFTMPEALTQWKMMVLAHTKELASAYSSKTTVTQKDLMVQPNAPRFLREGDRMEFSAKVVNLTDKEMTGSSTLELLDAATNQPVDGWFKNIFPLQYFTVPAGQSAAVKFPVDIPFNFNSAMVYRIKAISKDGSFSDGEEKALPVLSNRMLVTESMPLNMRNTDSKTFKFDKLLNSGNSGSLTNHALTIEYTSNPAWYAVQSLPYLMEYPYECAEQTFSRCYANILAFNIANSNPAIKTIFEKWKTIDTAALLSNLQKNEELKSVLLQETPWVLDAKNEAQQKKNIALLFDMVRLAQEKNKTLAKLKDLQTPNGGFAWFKGGRDDQYITQYIVTGIGHLRKLNAIKGADYDELKTIVDNALPYLDARIKDEYDELVKYKVDLSKDHLSYDAIQYLYMRSFFPETAIGSSAKKAADYFKGQSQKFWLNENKYMQAMIALALYRDNDNRTPKAIIESLRQNSISSEEMGTYWKDLSGGYYWYQAPVESQAMMIEAFSDIDKNTATVNDLKTWLLKQKQTQQWPTTKATAEACYALLLTGSDWISEEKTVTINLGNTVIKSTDEKTEAGTGYFKRRIEGEKVQQGMGNINVSVKSATNQPLNQSTSWGAIYWQYFEDLDKITPAATPLKLTKKLFVQQNSDHGPVLKAVNDGDQLKVGDKVIVRIELRSDRDMEYVHMKDMRAACMEPVNVISEYKYQGGLGYYESTKDASTNFFFDHISRGTYTFEYPVFVTLNGNFSNGITTIQCMYAPEFTSHSEGVRVNVE